MKEFTVKENDAFRVRDKKYACTSPSDLYAIDVIKEELHSGTVTFSTTNRLLMTEQEIKTLAQGLLA